jgi:hypothetical protein
LTGSFGAYFPGFVINAVEALSRCKTKGVDPHCANKDKDCDDEIFSESSTKHSLILVTLQVTLARKHQDR